MKTARALLLVSVLATTAPVPLDALEPTPSPAARATDMGNPEPRRPRRIDEFDDDFPLQPHPRPWNPRVGFGIGGCCHEMPDGQIYCHGVRS